MVFIDTTILNTRTIYRDLILSLQETTERFDDACEVVFFWKNQILRTLTIRKIFE